MLLLKAAVPNLVLKKAFFAAGCGQSGEKNNVTQDEICRCWTKG